jgi:hypothetical protein
MKNLNDFISEEDKKKEGIKPEKSSSRGADDKKYIRLMEKYKRARHGDKDEANKILKQAFTLAKDGDVSKQALVAGAYI